MHDTLMQGSGGWVVCRVFRKTKNINANSLDTYCSFKECQQVEIGMLQPEVVSLRKQEIYLDREVGSISITSQLHHPFNFTCKLEINVEDDNTTVHNSFKSNLHHLHRPHEAGKDHSPAPSSSTTLWNLPQGSRINAQNGGTYSSVPGFLGCDSSPTDLHDVGSSVARDRSLCSLHIPCHVAEQRLLDV